MSSITSNKSYNDFITNLKEKVRSAQTRAVLSVNKEMLVLYWEIGNDLNQKITEEKWGTSVITGISKEMRALFPDMKGFAPSSLRYMRQFAKEYPDFLIHQQPVGELP